MIGSFVASVILFSSVYGYSNCNTSPYPYGNRTNAPIPLIQTQQRPSGPGANTTFQIQVSGFIQITGPCTFSVINLTYSGVGSIDTAVWYGSFNNDLAGIYSVSLTNNVAVPISPNLTNLTYTFVTEAGREVSYNDFNEFRLFTLGNKYLLARATIPNTTIKAPAANVPAVQTTTPLKATVRTTPTTSTTSSASTVASVPFVSVSSDYGSKAGPWFAIAFLLSFAFMF